MVEPCKYIVHRLGISNRATCCCKLVPEVLHLGDVGAAGHSALLRGGDGDPKICDSGLGLRCKNCSDCSP